MAVEDVFILPSWFREIEVIVPIICLPFSLIHTN